MKIHGNNHQNGNEAHYLFIEDPKLRFRINQQHEEITDLAHRAARGDRFAEADYHRASATLLRIRPAISEDAQARQLDNARYLNDLADALDQQRIPPIMKPIVA